MAKATIDKLNLLHDLVATYYTEKLSSGEDLSSGELAAINGFLKTNNITASPLESDAVGGLSLKIANLLSSSEQDRKEIYG